MEIYNEIIAPVIEELVDIHSKKFRKSKKEIYENIKIAIGDLIKKYYKEPDIDYSDFYVRIGYLHCLVPGLAHCCSELIKEAQKKKYFREKKIDMIVFGGGPGTELLAISKNLKGKNINFCLVDKVMSWADCWNLLKKRIKERKQELRLSLDCDFMQIDVTNLEDLEENFSRLIDNEYFFINYLISDIYQKRKLIKFEVFLEKMIDYKVAHGKKMVIFLADRNEPKIKKEIERIFYDKIFYDLDLSQKFFSESEIGSPENYNRNLEPVKHLGIPKGSKFKIIQYIFESRNIPF